MFQQAMSVQELADHLGITPTTLWRRCKRHNIVPSINPNHRTKRSFTHAQVLELELIVRDMRKHESRRVVHEE